MCGPFKIPNTYHVIPKICKSTNTPTCTTQAYCNSRVDLWFKFSWEWVCPCNLTLNFMRDALYGLVNDSCSKAYSSNRKVLGRLRQISLCFSWWYSSQWRWSHSNVKIWLLTMDLKNQEWITLSLLVIYYYINSSYYFLINNNWILYKKI